MDTQQKLELLADASRHDLSCACATQKDEHRRRGPDGLWLYPVTLPSGGTSVMLKTLLSNACSYDCRYCPFRSDQDPRRCTLSPDEIAAVFLEYARSGRVFGLFLSSGVIRDPDYTMDRMAAVARILRKKGYRGYLHLKVIPGASEAAIEELVSLSSAVSLNVEVPTAASFAALSQRKDFHRDIVRPMRAISRLTAKGGRYSRVKTSTQFIVGASDEKDADIVRATYGLYRRLGLSRVYFSAYQRGLGAPSLPGERKPPAPGATGSQGPRGSAVLPSRAAEPGDLLTREHRLYQADFLIRRYRWDAADILFEPDGNLSLAVDPKQRWADSHPELFPVRLLSAEKESLLRARREGVLRGLADVGLRGERLRKASGYVLRE